jgi:hypothetical protein
MASSFVTFFRPGVWIVGSDQNGRRSDLTEEHAEDRRRPFRHVDLRDGLRQAAGLMISLAQNVEPYGIIGVGWIELARMNHIRERPR